MDIAMCSSWCTRHQPHDIFRGVFTNWAARPKRPGASSIRQMWCLSKSWKCEGSEGYVFLLAFSQGSVEAYSMISFSLKPVGLQEWKFWDLHMACYKGTPPKKKNKTKYMSIAKHPLAWTWIWRWFEDIWSYCSSTKAYLYTTKRNSPHRFVCYNTWETRSRLAGLSLAKLRGT